MENKFKCDNTDTYSLLCFIFLIIAWVEISDKLDDIIELLEALCKS